ncbi:MAG: hypothetical protein A2538_01235 [Candidatus Magasanikbacteria bacterium RIFOXYD2_FULL_41_14]|uniref:Uncharacterized protein n=1 Tax=Candidatus Magasanikbacteria bacterium RIFOXYD2_FULL_41_14 TaxID=1798709 RepID=A0A1F6PCE4_9BACT|nr:MAG: hypothetical protein A2538_01235 [Candidatus Magasanikbacteria bacterium RIFOXYD2_FULL_41_14]
MDCAPAPRGRKAPPSWHPPAPAKNVARSTLVDCARWTARSTSGERRHQTSCADSIIYPRPSRGFIFFVEKGKIWYYSDVILIYYIYESERDN